MGPEGLEPGDCTGGGVEGDAQVLLMECPVQQGRRGFRGGGIKDTWKDELS